MRRLFAVPGIRRMMCVFAALVMICGCMVSFTSAEGTELALEGYIRGAFTMDSLFAAAESALEDGMEAKQVVQEMIALADSEDALEFLNRAMDNCAAADSEESKKILAMLEADVVHVHSPFVAGQLGVGFAQKRGLPLVGTFHSKYYDDFLQVTGVELLAEVGVKYVVNFYEKCDEVWAVSQSSAETLHGYGYEGPIRVMPNGTDIHAVPPGKADEARERYGLTDAPLLLYAGQINWKKNLRCTLEACARLPGDFQLVLAGQGPHEAEVRALAARLGFSKKLRLTGHLCDAGLLNALYGLADLFVFPSLYDTSGLVVREAAAMGTPSVVVADSSAAEGIADGENGYLCENDPESLADAIQRALGDREGLRAVGERAKATIPIPWSRLVDDVLARYAELAGRR